jgi:aspartate racemase
MKHIGIVAVSAEGAALCYRTICSEGAALLGTHNHPQVSMHTFPLAKYMEPIYRDCWDDVGKLLLQSAERVHKAGAEFLICPDNTVHQAFDIVLARSPLPWLHIADEVARAAEHAGYRKLLVLGTRYLMEGPVYPSKLCARGIQCEIPSAAARARINQHIFDELVYGRFDAATREYFVSVIAEHGRSGCDAVVLGCTEIPLLVTQTDSRLPILDSTRILARAALREAAAL